MLASFLIPFVIVTSIFLMLSYFSDGKPDIKLSVMLGFFVGFMICATCMG